MTIAGYTKIGIIGAGSMGSEMAQLFAEAGLKVAIFDVKGSNVDNAIEYANKNPGIRGMVQGFKEYGHLMAAMPLPGHRLFVFSITHGDPADQVLKQLRPHLTEGDIILDGGNEWYLNTERRMHELKREQNVDYIGMGVSGGYQSARRGPSLSPGGDPDALQRVMPLLERVAAKTADGIPCVAPIGPRGSGHYVKMIHNGIEQGMMGALAEAWGLLRFNTGLELDEIGRIFEQWNKNGELRSTFLIDIGADICAKRDSSVAKGGASDNEDHVLSVVLDKVVQDADETEGTGTWSVSEASHTHISAPTIACSHFLRLASADRTARLKIGETLKLSAPPVHPRTTMGKEEKTQFVEYVRQALHAAFLASFTQGLQIIARKSEKEGWGVSLQTCLRIWRAGCIISSDGLSEILQDVVREHDQQAQNDKVITNGDRGKSKGASSLIPAHPAVTTHLAKDMPALRSVVLWGLERDAYIPTLSATLEWVKYIGARALPTMFMEAELDYFGAHKFDTWDSDAAKSGGNVMKGSEHYEWKAP